MRFGSLLAQAREAGRLEALYRGHQRAYLREKRREAFRKGPVGYVVLTLVVWVTQALLWLLPALPAVLAFLTEFGGKWFFIAVLLFYESGSLRVRKIASLNVFEALRMPSREALLGVRWVRNIPFFLWRGLACTLVALAGVFRFAGPWRWSTVVFLAAVGLTPLANGLLVGVKRLGDGGWKPGAGWSRVAFLVSLNLFSLWKLAVFLFVALPVSIVEGPFSSSVLFLGPVGLSIVGLSFVVFLKRELEVVRRCEIPTLPWWLSSATDRAPSQPREARLAPERPVDCSLPSRPVRQGLWGAELGRFREEYARLISPSPSSGPLGFATRINDMLSSLSCSLLLARGPVLAVAAIYLAGEPLAIPLAVASALFASRVTGLSVGWLGTEESERLYLWGVDLRDQVFHDLKALLVFGAIPTLASAAIASIFMGPELDHAATAFLIGSVFAFRSGIRGLFALSEFTMAGGCLLFTLGITVLAVLIVTEPRLSPADVVKVSVMVGSLGGMGLLNRIRRLKEPRLLLEMRRLRDPAPDRAG